MSDDAIEVTMFPQPSGGVRGLVNASITIKGKIKRIAHATLLVDAPPDIALDMPRKVAVTDISSITSLLNEFIARVTALDVGTDVQEA